ncbi:hypothetical protein N657DRAFT_216949 [Parathielavia appendiculata]|uniref:Uncharacterized protein n=1 Tax=Parathielavia appendiculata TaxID=2587402 RepID=A0AAN6U7F0_9PEZI|nr:hypothetical protein N657DRAFT_216949 [Parathielavia appendiculata]
MASASLTSLGGASRPMNLQGHFAPLRYANAEDLPSYPSPGLKPGDAAASAAATLGWASTPSGTFAAAGPGSPRGHQFNTPRSHDAILAADVAGWAQRHRKPPSPPASHQWVSTAASLAFGASKTPPPTTEHPQHSRHDSMSAALGALASSRPRAASSPQASTERNTDRATRATALSAATLAHQPTMRANSTPVGEVGAVPYTTMDREMFTANPPVKPKTDEKNRADVLHASALAMAKKMYDTQQRMIDSSAPAHALSSSFPCGDTTSRADQQSEEQPALVHNSLQESAYRLARERLAKLQQEHEKQRGLQEFYGSGTAPLHWSKLGTIKGKLTRKRSSSDGDLLEDKRRSERIRNQMSLLNSRLSEVDKEKRARDREALVAAAQRNVKAQMQRIDEQVQSDTGRVPQVNLDDWGRQALVAARVRYDAIGQDNVGKVDIGCGKIMERSEVKKIAAQKVQPLLDEINDRAEKELVRQEEEKLEEERRKELAERDKMREKEIQKIHKKLMDQQKEDERVRKAEVKREAKAHKDEIKAAKAEQKHAAQEAKQKESEVVPPTTSVGTKAEGPLQQPSPKAAHKRSLTVGHVRALSINFSRRPPRHKGKEAADQPPNTDDNSPTSPTGKVRAWLLSRFPRPRAKSTGSTPPANGEQDANETKHGFIGGVTLARLRQGKQNSSTSSIDSLDRNPHDANSSMREVALAGRRREPSSKRGTNTTDGESTTPPPPVEQMPVLHVSQATEAAPSVVGSVGSLGSDPRSSVSSSNSCNERFVEARSEPETSGGGSLASASMLAQAKPRPRAVVAGRVSPFRESRFSEIL